MDATSNIQRLPIQLLRFSVVVLFFKNVAYVLHRVHSRRILGSQYTGFNLQRVAQHICCIGKAALCIEN